jgi:hypothetical protein
MKTTAHKKKRRGICLTHSPKSNFPGLWLKPKGPTKDFRLILSRSKVMTSFLLTFARELSMLTSFEHQSGTKMDPRREMIPHRS